VVTSVEPRRPGRPVRLDAAGVATPERLLASAAAACVEHGFEGVTLGDVARRAGVSTPAVYNHYRSKAELLVAAGRWALDRLPPGDPDRRTPAAVVRSFLGDGFADSRRLMVELHLAGQRHPDVAALLADWHADHARVWAARAGPGLTTATVTVFFAFLLGLCQIEGLSDMSARADQVEQRALDMVAVLFPEEGLR